MDSWMMGLRTTRTSSRAAGAASARAVNDRWLLVLICFFVSACSSEPAVVGLAADGGKPAVESPQRTEPGSIGGTGGTRAARAGSETNEGTVGHSGRGGHDDAGDADMPRDRDDTSMASNTGEPAGGPAPSTSDAGLDGTTDSAAEPPMRPSDPVASDQNLIADETADADALQRLADWSRLPVLGTGRYEQQSSSDRGKANPSETMLLPISGHGNRDFNNFVCKSADAQLTPTLIAYQFDLESCPDTYVRGVVLGRYEGSGRLVRLWMTAGSISQPGGKLANEMLRVYVDDNPRPLIQARLADVMRGAAGEIFAPPFGAASDAMIAWYYPVVFGKKLIVAIDRLSSDYYYQTDVVLDPEPRPRFAPLQRLAERDRALAQLSAAAPAPDAHVLGSESITLTREQPRVVMLGGPATIQDLRLRVATDRLASLESVRVSVRWDGAGEPAIDLPLLDLFVARRAVVARSNLALAASTDSSTRSLSLRLPMPFKTSAQWTLTQTAAASVDFELEWLGGTKVPDASFGYLNVQQHETPLPAMAIEQPLAAASGRGRYVGMCADLEGRADTSLGIFGSAPLNLLEGDFRAMVDGRRALDGTGTEDYPDNAFYFRDTPKATPFAQNWGLVDDMSASPPGQVSFCRWQVLGNEVDFQSELTAIHELAIADPSIVDLHRTMAFLYLP
jgi:hypothetical protein